MFHTLGFREKSSFQEAGLGISLITAEHVCGMFHVRRKQLFSIGWAAPFSCCFLTNFFVDVESVVTEVIAKYVKDSTTQCRDDAACKRRRK